MIIPVQRQRVSETTKNFLFFSAVPSQVATPMTRPARKRLKAITIDWHGLAEVFLRVKSCKINAQPDSPKQTILNCSEYFGTYDGICPPSGNSIEHETSDCLRRGPRQASRSTVPLTAKKQSALANIIITPAHRYVQPHSIPLRNFRPRHHFDGACTLFGFSGGKLLEIQKTRPAPAGREPDTDENHNLN